MQDWTISLADTQIGAFSSQNHEFASVTNILTSPMQMIEAATLQKFAKITPQYPGVRAALPQSVSLAWLNELSPLLDTAFGSSEQGWEMQAWFSLVTARPGELIPMQRFPHVDGTDPRQVAMMLYLHDTPHGGTGFFRQRSTGLEALTVENFPRYRQALENDVRTHGLPPPAYVTDGEPYFERTHVCEGAFNQAFLYRGNVLHSGLIDGSSELSPDPSRGRLTINAFFRPIEQAQMGSR